MPTARPSAEGSERGASRPAGEGGSGVSSGARRYGGPRFWAASTALPSRDAAAILSLGNATGGGRSFAGVLYYAAIYNKALSVDEVVNNAIILASNDDGG